MNKTVPFHQFLLLNFSLKGVDLDEQLQDNRQLFLGDRAIVEILWIADNVSKGKPLELMS